VTFISSSSFNFSQQGTFCSYLSNLFAWMTSSSFCERFLGRGHQAGGIRSKSKLPSKPETFTAMPTARLTCCWPPQLSPNVFEIQRTEQDQNKISARVRARAKKVRQNCWLSPTPTGEDCDSVLSC
jgi:hypothetical protein